MSHVANAATVSGNSIVSCLKRKFVILDLSNILKKDKRLWKLSYFGCFASRQSFIQILFLLKNLIEFSREHFELLSNWKWCHWKATESFMLWRMFKCNEARLMVEVTTFMKFQLANFTTCCPKMFHRFNVCKSIIK